jgi:hypothetical protein
MEFLVGKRLYAEIKRIAAERQARCAVAFWGCGAAGQFKHPKGVRLVCNLATGGTNPAVIVDLRERGANVRQHDTLHAKVYVGQVNAVVTSANASTNGLGLEDREQARWVEAGVLLKVTPPLEAWFEDIWNHSRAITRFDLEKATKLWAARQRGKPSVPFENFIPGDKPPLLAYVPPHYEEIIDESSVRKQLGKYNQSIRQRIEGGIPIEGRADEEAVKGDRWLLTWVLGSGGINKRTDPWWSYVSGDVILRDVIYHKDEKPPRKYAVALAKEDQPPPPFNPGDPRFKRTLAELLAKREYKALTTEEYSGAWYTKKRLALGVRLWGALVKRYREASGAGWSKDNTGVNKKRGRGLRDSVSSRRRRDAARQKAVIGQPVDVDRETTNL